MSDLTETNVIPVDPKACPDARQQGPRAIFHFERLSEYGVLWLINRTVFHPRGFALALEYEDGHDTPAGWSIQGDGSEPWRFEGVDEDGRFNAIEGLFAQAREFGHAPHAMATDLDGEPS